MTEFTFVRHIRKTGATELWRLLASHTSTAPVGGEPYSIPCCCPGCRILEDKKQDTGETR